MTRLRFTAAAVLLVLVACSLIHAPAAAAGSTSRSYAQSQARSAAGGWPLYPPSDAQWNLLFTGEDFQCWEDTQRSEYCFTRAITFAWGADSAAALCVSPAGVLWVAGEANKASCAWLRSQEYPGFSMYPAKSQPDYRFLQAMQNKMVPSTSTLALFLGFAASQLWENDVESMRYTVAADAFWLVGNLTGRNPQPDTAFAFTLCLCANQTIQLDVAALSVPASAEFDSTRMPVVGLQGGDFSTSVALAFASMWQPQPAGTGSGSYSTRLDWNPSAEDVSCMQMAAAAGDLSCVQCLVPGKCAWCAATSSCLGVNSALAGCPAPLMTESCPAAQYDSCAGCTAAGFVWNTGDADCAVTANNTEAYCGPDAAWLEWNTDNPVSHCVESVANVSTLSCDASYNTSFMSCGAGAGFRWSGLQDWGCVCSPDVLDTRVIPHDGVLPSCVECSPAVCNELYGTQNMRCALTDFVVRCACTEAYEGYSCTQCAPNVAYREKDGTCKMCPSLSPGLIALLVIAALVLTFFVVKLNSHPLIQRLLIPVSNAVVYCQVISLLALIDFHWPLSVRRAFNAFTIAGFNVVSLPSATCYMTAGEKFFISVSIMPAIAGVLCVALMGITVRNGRRAGSDPAALLVAHASNERFRILFLRSFLSLLMLLYNFLVYTVFDSYNHRDQGLVGSLAVGVYVAGPPVLFAVVLTPRCRFGMVNWMQCACCCRRKEQRSNVLQPLRGRYRLGMRYWEALFVPLWKIALNVLIVWAPRTVQIVCIAILLLLVMLAYARFKPYSSGLNNREQVWLLCGSLTILCSGVLFYFSSDADSDALRFVQVISYVIVAATMIVMAAVIVFVIASVTRQYFAEKKGAAKLVGNEEWEQQPGAAAGAASPPMVEEKSPIAVVSGDSPGLQLNGSKQELYHSLLPEGDERETDAEVEGDAQLQSPAAAGHREGIADRDDAGVL